jgi:hypothetical protein
MLYKCAHQEIKVKIFTFNTAVSHTYNHYVYTHVYKCTPNKIKPQKLSV